MSDWKLSDVIDSVSLKEGYTGPPLVEYDDDKIHVTICGIRVKDPSVYDITTLINDPVKNTPDQS